MRASGTRADSFTVAVAQMRPVFGETEENLRTIAALVRRAHDRGARLVVLPELCSTGYVFEDRDEALGLAEAVPDGPTVAAWEALCWELGLHLVAGIAERVGDALYNSSVLVGPEGFIGIYRKVHLWGREKLVFEPGDLRFPVFDTGLGRVAMVICYDEWFPESLRSCALGGADLVCVPTNWVPMAEQPLERNAMAVTLTMAGAHANGVYVAAADRVGTERGQPFEGQSVIVDHTGWPLAGPASRTDEELLLAHVSPSVARAARTWSEFNNPIADRRPDTYLLREAPAKSSR